MLLNRGRKKWRVSILRMKNGSVAVQSYVSPVSYDSKEDALEGVVPVEWLFFRSPFPGYDLVSYQDEARTQTHIGVEQMK